MQSMKVILSSALSLAFLFMDTTPTRPEGGGAPATLTTLDRALHFVGTDGTTNVLVKPGSYQVKQISPGQLGLVPSEGKEPIVIQALPTTHKETIVRSTALMLPPDPGDEAFHLVLLMPDGTGLDAVGSGSEVRTRGGLSSFSDQVRIMTAEQARISAAMQAVATQTTSLGGASTAPTTTTQKAPSLATAPAIGGTTGPSYIVGGTSEPDYKYPWVVRMNGCGGVLLDPRWVLTAAHCIDDQASASSIRISYGRTDPYTRVPETQERTGEGIKHPNFVTGSTDKRYDIALIKQREPFRITPFLQTVALPRSPFPPGIVGTLASLSNQPGTLAVYRATIPSIAAVSDGRILINTPRDTTASLCKGDSGSGLVTVENNRATVRGIAVEGANTGCIVTLTGEDTFSDVFAFRGWILQTMGKTDASLAGDTRIRRMGTTARGTMMLGCLNPYGNGALVGPLNVVGVEEGTMCAGGRQIIRCALDQAQDTWRMPPPAIVGFTVRTTMPNRAAEVRALPFSAQNTTYTAINGPLPAGASREFICQIGNPIGPGTVENTPFLQRGIDSEQPEESTPEPSSNLESSKETESK